MEEVADVMAEHFNADPAEVLALLQEALNEEGDEAPEAEAPEAAEDAPVDDAPLDEEADPLAEAEDVDDAPEADDEAPEMEPGADVGEFGEEVGPQAYAPNELRERLPDDVWEVVRNYLAEGGEEKASLEDQQDDVAYDADEEDADDETGGALGEVGKAEVSAVVRDELNKHISTATGSPAPTPGEEGTEPSHGGKTLEKEAPVSRTILSGFYN